jgi:hypothetical protein
MYVDTTTDLILIDIAHFTSTKHFSKNFMLI